jgi:shikimate kinase
MQILELCGMYGAGKSTLHRQLMQHKTAEVTKEYRLSRLQNIHRFVIYGLKMVPIILRSGFDRHWLWRLWLLIYLHTLADDLIHVKADLPGLLLWEEGPTALHAFLRTRIRSQRNQEIIDHVLDANLHQLAKTIDAIIWLDAADAVLVDRVRTRPQRHMLKEVQIEEAIDFYQKYRCAFEGIMQTYQNCGLPVLRITTDTQGAEEMTGEAVRFMAATGIQGLGASANG